MILKFVDIKDPVLRQVAKPVSKIDKKVLQLIADMKETLRVQSDPEGIGLAAPQIGKSLQIFLMDFEKTQRVVINPKIIKIGKTPFSANQPARAGATGGHGKTLEGCLSLPHYYGPIKREDEVTISYINEAQEKVEEKFKGFLAHIVLHEIDHLNGILFIDHILSQKAPLYKFHGEEWEEVELV